MFFKNINLLFTNKQKLFFYIIVAGGILATFFEMVGIGIIPIFAMIIISPSYFFNKFSNFLSLDFIDFYNQTNLVFLFSIILIIFFFIKNCYLIFLVYLQAQFLKNSRITVSKKIFEKYLDSEYIFHLRQNPSISMRIILNDVGNTFICINSYILLIRESFVMIGMFLFLLIANPLTSIMSLIALALPLGLLYNFYKSKMKLKGKELIEIQSGIIKLVNQAIGAIKETKIYKKENYFYNEYKEKNKNLEELIFYKNFITSIPRFFLEFIAICFIVIIVCVLFILGKTENTIPLITLITLISIRLIPSLNAITSSFSSIRFLRPSMEFVIKEISRLNENAKFILNNKSISPEANINKFSKNILLKNVSFDYNENRNKPVENISLEILFGQSVGIIGRSGSGKSTLLDIILGLLKPSSGQLLIDGINIRDANLISGWQRQIGYIPQDIYLLDSTIKSNIAFGISQQEIDESKMKKAIIAAQLEDFIKFLPLKENTLVGNRGVKLSGGQIQRIGIARAIYNEPKILIFDEATSSLDENNEQKIMDEVFNLKDKRTIIIVTHRYQTVKKCDQIFMLNDGKLIDKGNYNFLKLKYNLNSNS
jgi:ABC-type multidrug transport system fused ATPase/permease subunit